jgi:PhnB protein
MATVNPYLNFPGNSEEAFNFYKSVFGGEFSALFRFKDMPAAGPVPPEAADKLMHIALPIGKSNILMATDMIESMGQVSKEGNRYSLSLEAESKEEADKLFNGLSAGGKIETQISDAPWGAYWGMILDKYGIRWMVNYTYTRK